MNKPKAIRLINILLLILITMMSLSCEKEETVTGSVYAFSTIIDISITSYDAKTDYENVKNIILDTHKLCDNYNEYEGINNVCTLNKERTNVSVSDELVTLLSELSELKTTTDGYFNHYIGSLALLYKALIESGKRSDIPSDEVIALELEKMNNTSYKESDNNVSLEGEGLIDLGAVGKGYALRKVRAYLDSHNVKTYLINGGSSSIIFGEKEGSKDYKIGVREVDDLVLSKKNKAISTSSILEQFISIDDEIYHHIVNGKTGKNDHYYDTVVVVGDDPLLLDAYSTALFMMDKELVEAIKDSLDLDEIYLCKDNKVIYQYTRGK